MFGRRFATQFGRRATGSRRTMAGHAAVPTEGLDGFVRKYLPKDEHVVLGMFGFYTTMYLLSKLIFGGKKKVEAPVVAVVSHGAPSGSMPSVDSPEFEAWISKEGNIEKAFAAM